MGQFEIRGNKREELIPDIFILTVYASIDCKDVVDNTEAMDKAKDSLKKVVVKLVSDIEGVSDKCNVSFSNLSYSRNLVNDLFGASNQGFGITKKKQENHVNITATVIIKVKLSLRDEDILSSILKLLLNSVNITSISDTVTVSDLESKYMELKTSVCKKCRSDADTIVTSLGSKISGVEKVVYNSDGNLLDSSKETKVSKINHSRSLDLCDYEESFDFDDFSTDNIEKYDDIWAKGFVKTLLDRRFTIEDNVTVVFSIE